MRRPYTRDELELIAEGYRLGTPVAAIAGILGRTVNSVVSAAHTRGMRHLNNGENQDRRRKGAGELKWHRDLLLRARRP